VPTLLSSGPGSLTGLRLEQNAFWRLQLGVTVVDQTPALALVVRYPPGLPDSQIALLRVPVGIAQDAQEVQRLADVGLSMGTQEEDMRRLAEAYQMFKNNPRTPSALALEEATKAGQRLVEAFWQVREWIIEGSTTRLTLTVEPWTLQGLP
jgi:hypothetical protein